MALGLPGSAGAGRARPGTLAAGRGRRYHRGVPPSDPVTLEPAIARFVEGPVSIVLAVRGDGLSVDLAQGYAGRCAEGWVSVLIPRSQAEDVLELVARTGAVAVTFSRPSSHRTLQMKGGDARVEPASTDDLVAWRRYRDTFAAELADIGFGGAYAMAMLAVDEPDLMAVRFSPGAVFVQTPGPDAGKRVAAAREPG